MDGWMDGWMDGCMRMRERECEREREREREKRSRNIGAFARVPLHGSCAAFAPVFSSSISSGSGGRGLVRRAYEGSPSGIEGLWVFCGYTGSRGWDSMQFVAIGGI